MTPNEEQKIETFPQIVVICLEKIVYFTLACDVLHHVTVSPGGQPDVIFPVSKA